MTGPGSPIYEAVRTAMPSAAPSVWFDLSKRIEAELEQRKFAVIFLGQGPSAPTPLMEHFEPRKGIDVPTPKWETNPRPAE